MSFREKSSWITLLALFIVSWSYFSLLWARSNGLQALASPNLPDLIHYTVSFIVLLVVLHIVSAALSPKELSEAPDERERLIEVRASHYAGLALGVFVVFGLVQFLISPFDQGNLLFYTIMAGLIVSQLVESFLIIFYHRRGF